MDSSIWFDKISSGTAHFINRGITGYNFLTKDKSLVSRFVASKDLAKFCIIISALDASKNVFGVGEEQRRRPAFLSAQTDQRLCYSVFRKYYV